MDEREAPQITAALYARVSTVDKGQDPEVQMRELRNYAEHRGWDTIEFIDHASGAKESRPALDRMMDAAEAGTIQVVLVWRFDRFGRSTQHLIRSLERFRLLDVNFVSAQEHLDLSTPMGEFVFTILAALAQMERRIIQERVRAGLAKAKEDGVQLGRPPKKIDLRPALAMLRDGESVSEVAKATGISRRTLVRRLRKAGHEIEAGFLAGTLG